LKYKRLNKCILTLILLSAFLFSCDNKDIDNFNKNVFSVTFLSVGQGDSIFVNFPDGKNMLIDCGEEKSKNADRIIEAIEKSGKSELDVLVLTHPAVDHIGNCNVILDRINVKEAFIPDLKYPENYSLYYPVYEKVKDKAEIVKSSDTSVYFSGENYFVAVLSPLPYETKDSLYNDINEKDVASSSEINDISAVIYMEYDGVRFVFLADAGKKSQKHVLQNYNVGLYDGIYGDNIVNLEHVDVVKVSHHGAYDYTDRSLHSLLNAKYAVISVGNKNSYGHPHSSTLKILSECNSNVNILRTDTHKDIRLEVIDGKIKIVLEKGEL